MKGAAWFAVFCWLCLTQAAGANEPGRLVVENAFRSPIEFSIKASERSRRWTKISVPPGQERAITLKSVDPFDILIRFPDGEVYQACGVELRKHIEAGDWLMVPLDLQPYGRWSLVRKGRHGRRVWVFRRVQSDAIRTEWIQFDQNEGNLILGEKGAAAPAPAEEAAPAYDPPQPPPPPPPSF